MCESSRPHYACARLVVIRVRHYLSTLRHDRPHQRFAKRVGKFDVFRWREVSFADVRKHVCKTASRLERRQGRRKLGIHHRELRAKDVAAGSALQVLGLEIDDAVRRRLASSRGDRKDDANGKRSWNHRLHLDLAPDVELSPLTAVRGADCNRLGGVDHASTADRENEVDLVL